MTDSEEWRAVPGWEGMYEVRNLGRVKSLARIVKSGRARQRRTMGRILKTCINTGGYPSVGMREAGRREVSSVHRLVLRAFAGEPPPGYQACHNDGCRSNPVLSNLRWDTRAGNEADKIGHGTLIVGEQSHFAKLTEGCIREILRRVELGDLQRDIAADFGVDQSTISDIKRGKSWRHLRIELTKLPT